MDSIKKNTVEATIAIETTQKEMATGSFGSRNPFKAGFAAIMSVEDILQKLVGERDDET
jgi:hypothetical protein